MKKLMPLIIFMSIVISSCTTTPLQEQLLKPLSSLGINFFNNTESEIDENDTSESEIDKNEISESEVDKLITDNNSQKITNNFSRQNKKKSVNSISKDAISSKKKVINNYKKRDVKLITMDNSTASSKYIEALELINSGNRNSGINLLQEIVIALDYLPAKTEFDRLNSPFTLAIQLVEKYLNDWLQNPDSVPEFTLKKPDLPILKKRPILVKDEFETTNDFNLRAEIAEREYQLKVDNIIENYKESVDFYNNEVDAYNANIEWERKSRYEKIPAMRKRYLDIAFSEVLGTPHLDNLKYDADNEVFYGKIISEFENLKLNVKIPVLLADAQKFKEDSQNIKPNLKIELIDGNIVFSNVSIDHGNNTYPAILLSGEKILKNTSNITIGKNITGVERIETKGLNKLKVKKIINANRQFFSKNFN
jgi:hypothetical protein